MLNIFFAIICVKSHVIFSDCNWKTESTNPLKWTHVTSDIYIKERADGLVREPVSLPHYRAFTLFKKFIHITGI